MEDLNTITPITGAVDPQKSTVQGQMGGLLSKDSEYMQRAKTSALQQMNKRGVANSSMAVGATHAAAIDAALPIADADAKSYFNQDLANQQIQNEFKKGEQTQQFQKELTGINQDNQLETIQKQAELQSSLNAEQYLADQDRDRLAAQLDLAQGQTVHQQDIEKAYLQAISNIRNTASSDAALIGRTEGLSAEQQQAAMDKVYAQATIDIDFMQQVFSQPQQWNW